MQAEAKDRGKGCARERHADDSPSADPTARAATPYTRRHGAKTTKYPKAACFMTWPAVTATSIAREVKLYLALPSPSSSRRALPDPIPSPSSVPSRTHSGPAGATLEVLVCAHERLDHVQDQRPHLEHFVVVSR